MKQIAVTNSQPAMVDDDDYERISASKWHLSGNAYPTRIVIDKSHPSGRYREGMHRTVLALPFGDRRHVDHINGDVLDNRKSNLRICTAAQNAWNAKKRKDNVSGRKGVYWNSSHKKWVAKITCNKKLYILGSFDSLEKACEARRNAEIELFGDFAKSA